MNSHRTSCWWIFLHLLECSFHYFIFHLLRLMLAFLMSFKQNRKIFNAIVEYEKKNCECYTTFNSLFMPSRYVYVCFFMFLFLLFFSQKIKKNEKNSWKAFGKSSYSLTVDCVAFWMKNVYGVFISNKVREMTKEFLRKESKRLYGIKGIIKNDIWKIEFRIYLAA